jgi:short-subunit dehydrogenase
LKKYPHWLLKLIKPKKMNILITGHTKGIGKAILDILVLNKQINVLGIARTKLTRAEANLTQWQANLADPAEVQKICNKLKKEKIDIAILNAGYNTIKPHDGYSFEEIFEITQLNFTTPLQLIRACLPHMLAQMQGKIIALSSYSAIEVNKMNNYYGAAKAGLLHFMRNLFENYRKQNLQVTTIVPDIVNSNFYEHQSYEPTKHQNESIDVNEIAQTIVQVVISQEKMVVTEMVLRPQKFGLSKK